MLTVAVVSTIMLISSLHYASICSHAFTYYYAQNYASIIHQGLTMYMQLASSPGSPKNGGGAGVFSHMSNVQGRKDLIVHSRARLQFSRHLGHAGPTAWPENEATDNPHMLLL